MNLTEGGQSEWLKHKENLASPNTIVRHRQHFRKYLLSSRLHDKKIRSVDELLMEEECNRIVREFNLSKNEWTNLKTILKGCFDFAIRKKYLTVDPTERLKISVKFRQVNKKTGKTETYNSEDHFKTDQLCTGEICRTAGMGESKVQPQDAKDLRQSPERRRGSPRRDQRAAWPFQSEYDSRLYLQSADGQ